MLTTKTKYGLRALCALAAAHPGGGRLTTAQIAREEEIPAKFLEAILLELKQHGLLNSKRGRDGGYALARHPESVFLGQIVRILDGPLAPTPCVSKERYQPCEDCPDEAKCVLRNVMAELREAIASVLDTKSLDDLLQSRQDMNDDTPPMYYI